MSKKKKYDPIKLNVKPVWAAAKGHYDFRGDTVMDSRPKRKRTRQTKKRDWLKDYD